MKRFVIIVSTMALIVMGIYYAVFYQGVYINISDKPIVTLAKIEEKEIFVKQENGNYVPFEIKGVVVTSAVPGKRSSDYAVDVETWLRWFGQIQEMGANTIRIYTIYDEDFYEAFYQYNLNKEEPLYLLQGIQVTDYANNSVDDAYGEEFYPLLLEDAFTAVDVIHGQRDITLNVRTGSGTFRRDVSEWVLGYLVGSNWNAGTIEYTNHNHESEEEYQGSYFATKPGASEFEKMMAEIMDTMVRYESEKYRTQRLISFVNEPATDPFEYEPFYGKQLGKYVCMDAENIMPYKEKFSGYYAAYQMYDFCANYAEYFDDVTQEQLAAILRKINPEYYYGGYAQLLAEYHTVPVVVTGFGYATSRGTDSEVGSLTETEQGERLLATYEDIMESGCNGAFIETWQDAWERTSWNTTYAIDLLDNVNWHDVQTVGENTGILAFEPGKEIAVCYVDGDDSEWINKKPIIDEKGYKLFATYDAEYMYFYLQGEDVTAERSFYLPIDTNQSIGSKRESVHNLNFSRAADFLLCIRGEENSELLVQARYDSLRQNYLENITGEDPYEDYPRADSNIFVPIRMALKATSVLSLQQADVGEEREAQISAYETGELTCGNANPNAVDYNSLADFCYGENGVEIRIPWALLNFSNPADMKIHKDYYVNYGREDERISKLYIGIGNGESTETIMMRAMELQSWGMKVESHERLKDSYDIIKKGWVSK